MTAKTGCSLEGIKLVSSLECIKKFELLILIYNDLIHNKEINYIQRSLLNYYNLLHYYSHLFLTRSYLKILCSTIPSNLDMVLLFAFISSREMFFFFFF